MQKGSNREVVRPIGPLASLGFGALFQVLDVEFERVESVDDVLLIDVGGES